MKKFLLLGSSLLLFLCIKAQTPVAYYPFSGNANDVIGSLNGIVNGGASLTTDRFGNANSAYSFDGVNDVISFASVPMTNIDNFTLMAWVNPALFDPSNQFNKMIVSLGPGDNGYNMGMGNNSSSGAGNQLGGLYNLVAWLPSGTLLNTINTWYHVAMVRTSGITKFYLNGVQAPNTFTATPNAFTTGFQIGGQDFDPTHYWNGKIDEVKIYNVALTSLQIQQEYASSSQLQKPGSGNAISFNGSSQSVNIPNAASINFGISDFSIGFWYNSANNSRAELVLEKRDDNCGDGQNWSVRKAADEVYIEINVLGPTSNVVTIPNAADGKWHHIVFTRTATQLSGFKDGVLIATTNASAQNVDNIAALQIATGPCSPFFPGGNGFFAGSLDELQFWNTALTQAQIRDRMCRKITSADALYSNLVAYYNFDESTGAIAFDGTINANNGTFVNNPTRVTSGAAIGNASSHDYVNATKTTSLAHASGESFTVTSASGNPDGIQLYRVDEQPNTTSGINSLGASDKYFGVFQINGTAPQYTGVYNYTGNPAVTGATEPQLRLNKRTDNAAGSWSVLSILPNQTANTISVSGESTEYILGVSGSPLPLNLIYFNGSIQNGNTTLSWKTNNEINTLHFEIENSNGTSAFSTIAVVQAQQLSNGSDYGTVHTNPFINGAVQYYRLKIIDKNGRFTYSNIIRLTNSSGGTDLSIFPNPAAESISISSNKKQEAVLTNSAGQLITKIVLLKGSQTINISKLATGIYFIKGETVTVKFIKQ